MKKLIAFTIAEIVICLTIIGVLAAVTISTIDTQNFYQKSYLTGARKIVNEFNQASLRIREEQSVCPDGSFLSDVSNNSAIFSCNLSDANIVSVYQNYIKYKTLHSSGICISGVNATGNTSSMCPAGSTRPGFKLQNGAFVGFELFTNNLTTCRYYDFETMIEKQKKAETINMTTVPMLTVPTTGANGTKLKTQTQCWARLWVDMNGKTGPNIEGQDVFGFYIGSQGLVN